MEGKNSSTNNKKEPNGIALLLVDIQNDFIDGSLAVPEAKDILPIVNELIKSFPYDILVASQDFHPSGHISFASSHKGMKEFKEYQIPHPNKQKAEEGVTITQMMWPDHCIQGTRGAEFEESIKESMENKRKLGQVPVHIVQKGTDLHVDGYSAFADNQYLSFTELSKILFSYRAGEGSNKKEIDTVIVVGLATDFCVFSSAIDSTKFHFRTIVLGDAIRGVTKQSSDSTIKSMKSWGIEYVQTENELRKMLGK